MPEWFLNLDGGILLWLQEAVRNAVLTPLFTLYTHLGDSGLMWIALSVLLLCFKKTRKAGAAGLMALLLSQRDSQAPGGAPPALADGGGADASDRGARPQLLPFRTHQRLLCRSVGLVPHSAPPVGGGDGGGAGRPDGLLTAVCRGPLPQ